MPRGPSHSRGGGGFGGSRSGGGFGGSRGGGFSFGGSSRRSSSRSTSSYSGGGYYHRPPRGPRTIRWFGGRTIVVSNGKFSGFIALLVICLFFIMTTFGMWSNLSDIHDDIEDVKESIEIYEEDAVYYENLIDNAINGVEGYYLATAEFKPYLWGEYIEPDDDDTGAFEYIQLNGYSYYYIIYQYFNSDANSIAQGETYTQFTSSQVTSMIIGTGSSKLGHIQIAYTYDERDGGYYSINTSYTLEKNQDYQYAKWYLDDAESDQSLTRNLGIAFTIISIILVASLVLIVIKTIKKAKKDEAVQDAKNQAEIAEAEAKAEEAQAKADRHNRFCMYCGAQIPADEDVCPSCGSRQFEKE